jgi:hypothetical protein
VKELERDLQRAVEQYLAARRDIWWMRVNPGDRMIGGRMIRGAPTGTADLIGCGPSGRFWAVELKTTKGRLTDAQTAFLARVESIGGATVVARSVGDVARFLDGLREKAKTQWTESVGGCRQ